MEQAKAVEYLEGDRECPYCNTKQVAGRDSTEYEDSETHIVRRECAACKNTWLDLYDFAAVATDDHNENEKDSETFGIPQKLCRCQNEEPAPAAPKKKHKRVVEDYENFTQLAQFAKIMFLDATGRGDLMAALKWNDARLWAGEMIWADRAHPDKDGRIGAYGTKLSMLVDDMETLKKERPARLYQLAECHQRMQFVSRMRANISRSPAKPLGLGWLRDLASDLIQGKAVG